MVKILGLLAAGCLLAGRPAHGAEPRAPEDPGAAFYAARAAYDAGRFEDAAALYEGLIRAGAETAETWFNLGNARYRTGEFGRAALAYRRAARFRPRDPDIGANLLHVQRAAGSATAPDSAAYRWIRMATPREWAAVGLLGYVSGFLVLCVLAFAPRRWRRVGRGILFACAALAAAGAAGRGAWSLFDRRPEAVVVAPGGTDARFAPLSDARVHFHLPAASIVRKTAESGGWMEIRLGRAVGWIPADAAESVADPLPDSRGCRPSAPDGEPR